jgi:hypothetical protein
VNWWMWGPVNCTHILSSHLDKITRLYTLYNCFCSILPALGPD